MNRPSRTNAGFTLIELIASAVLTAILMTALLNVVWSVSRESSRLRASETTHFPVTQLAQQLRLDFQNARGMVVQAGGVTLHGFVGAQTQLIPGRVQYATQRVAGRQLLICRRGKEPADPVWIDFGGLIVEPLESDESDDGLVPDPVSGGLPPIPGKFRVTLLNEKNQVLWREVIHHHAS